jgi:hypothetical protein
MKWTALAEQSIAVPKYDALLSTPPKTSTNAKRAMRFFNA